MAVEVGSPRGCSEPASGGRARGDRLPIAAPGHLHCGLDSACGAFVRSRGGVASPSWYGARGHCAEL
eukprot:3190682-Alexandrium_andersonii.AAC.1